MPKLYAIVLILLVTAQFVIKMGNAVSTGSALPSTAKVSIPSFMK